MAKNKKTKPESTEKAGITFDNISEVKDMLSGVSISLGGFGIQKKVDRAENILAAEALEAEEDCITTTRRLIDKNMEEYKDIQRTKTAVREWFAFMTLPYPVDKIRLFRKDQREEIWAKAEEWKGMLAEGARKLTRKRPQIIEWAKCNLGKAFDERLYPKDFAANYTLEIREHNIEPPSYLAASKSEEYQGELQKRMTEIQAGMQQFQRQAMAQIGSNVGNLVAAMSTDGKRVEGSNLEQMRKVFAKIANFNFQGTAMFRAAMDEYKEAVDGVGAAELRRPGGVREETKEKLTKLMERYKTLQEENLKAMGTP